MKPSSIAKSAARAAFNPFEEIFEQTKPIGSEAFSELFGRQNIGTRPKELAREDLERARQAKNLEEKRTADDENSQTQAAEKIMAIKNSYKEQENSQNREQTAIGEEVETIKAAIVDLAKAEGLDTKIHLELKPKKLGVLDLKRYTFILRLLRVKATQSKSAKDLVRERANAKTPTGMMAWVSGKQMQIHEQGTMQLQG